jgi:hypothetical protein
MPEDYMVKKNDRDLIGLANLLSVVKQIVGEPHIMGKQGEESASSSTEIEFKKIDFKNARIDE